MAVRNWMSKSAKHNVAQCLTCRLRGAIVQALNGMDPDLIKTPGDSSALQQTSAPDAISESKLSTKTAFLLFNITTTTSVEILC